MRVSSAVLALSGLVPAAVLGVLLRGVVVPNGAKGENMRAGLSLRGEGVNQQAKRYAQRKASGKEGDMQWAPRSVIVHRQAMCARRKGRRNRGTYIGMANQLLCTSTRDFATKSKRKGMHMQLV